MWLPVTKLGCLVKDMKIKSLEEISLFSLPIKEYDIIDFFLGASLKDEVLKIAAAAKSLQSCPTLCHPIDGSPPGSPVPGILQPRTLEWVAMPLSRRSSQPRARTGVSCIAGGLFTI